MKHSLSTTACLGLVTFLSAFLMEGRAATIPYNISFTTSAPGSEDMFGARGGTGWTVQTEVGTLTASMTTNGQTLTASTQLSNAAGQSFTLETPFSFSALNAGGAASAVGVGLFGTNNNFASGYLLVDWNFDGNTDPNGEDAGRTGKLRLNAINGAGEIAAKYGVVDPDHKADVVGPPPQYFAANTGQEYVLRVVVTNVSGNTYNIAAGIYKDGVTLLGEQAISNYTAPTEPGGGYYFGLRNRNVGTLANTIVFTDFSVTQPVPEPQTAVLLLSALGISIYYGWRKAHPRGWSSDGGARRS